jgi:hypothetical protein
VDISIPVGYLPMAVDCKMLHFPLYRTLASKNGLAHTSALANLAAQGIFYHEALHDLGSR